MCSMGAVLMGLPELQAMRTIQEEAETVEGCVRVAVRDGGLCGSPKEPPRRPY